jgi:E3 ubiquitin-protein ligase HUWE1
MLGGEPAIDIQDWKDNTSYQGNYRYLANSTAVLLFWDYLKSLDQKDLAKVLQFSTGASRLPAGGFKNLKYLFTLYRTACDYALAIVLPKAHTCYSQLDLPDYRDAEVLRNSFEIALNWGQGFDE